ncbi:aminomethyltransferase [Marinobacterium zhoushanense]|uniref:Aminomethyltransferase n=1 Tax=Marinobacterium zhoushanense TaxID=1679163 RepID=A0ABQ1K5V3_9GAMM|nr:aminomethyltransferase family protein [Marinobacterium zhoushanense]GGB85314.1 aminomethyltransferase [Marinobacterium zhoushanense]
MNPTVPVDGGEIPAVWGLTSQHRTHRIPGQSAHWLSLRSGESIEIVSPDAIQCCELLPLDDYSRDQVAALLPDVVEPASLYRAQLAQSGASAKRLHRQLERFGVADPALAQGWQLDAGQLPFSLVLPPDASPVTLLLLAPGLDMAVDQHVASGELLIEHRYRSAPLTDLPLPATDSDDQPLPIREIHVPHSSARAYEVKAGEWIQVSDVAGKQCSDFIAFDLDAIKRGDEIVLDSTATRTLAGVALPQPGLYSRFADQNMVTMLELVQDTVGRHDSFLFACTSKYYEDAGYFGHISCTANFNRALKPYGVRPRAGWPAINFFFNTQAQPCGTIGMDEPWSRPGDYVLMRASRDLLCVSSACPDDIDPANGWCPTDIHIRIFAADAEFPRAIATRTTPLEPARMTKPTAFHSRTSALTRHFTEYRGYWVPTEFDGFGARAEYLSCRERVAVMDLSPLRKFEVTGPDAEALLQKALTRNVRRLAIGAVVYSAICHETGGMIDDGTLFRMGEQAFRWICGDPYTGIWLRELAAREGYRVRVQESTDQLHNLAVQGPQSRALLSKIIWTPEAHTPVESLAWFHFTVGRLGGPQGIPVMVSRTGYTGELGFEVWCHPDQGAELWDAIWQAGQPLGLAPLGFDALDMLRIEAGLIFAGYEFCPETDPYAAGIGFTVPLKSKEEDFVGRTALARIPASDRERLMGLVLDSEDLISHGDQLFNGRFPVGVVTSATRSPLIGKTIALVRLMPEFAEPGTRLEVGQLDGQQKRLPGQVVALPFHDPERIRVRS